MATATSGANAGTHMRSRQSTISVVTPATAASVPYARTGGRLRSRKRERIQTLPAKNVK